MAINHDGHISDELLKACDREYEAEKALVDACEFVIHSSFNSLDIRDAVKLLTTRVDEWAKSAGFLTRRSDAGEIAHG